MEKKRTCVSCGGEDLIIFPEVFKTTVRLRRVREKAVICRSCGCVMNFLNVDDLRKVERLPGDNRE